MAKRKFNPMQNNLPLVVVLVMVVFVLPLMVFSVVFHTFSLTTEASTALVEKNYQTVRGTIEVTKGAKGDELILLTSKFNKTYKLTGSETTLNTLKRFNGTSVVAVGWTSTNGLFVTSVSAAR